MPIRVLQVLHQGGGAGSVTSTLHLSAGLQRAGNGVGFVCPPDSEVEALPRRRSRRGARGSAGLRIGAAGNLDLIAPEVSGLLVPPLDAGAWAAAIDRVLGDRPPGRRLGAAARRTARGTFSLERTVERTLGLYHARVDAAPLAPGTESR